MLRAVSSLLLLIAVACGVTACGGDSAIPGTPPGPYALTITATSSGAAPVVHTLNVTANVTVPY
jgi:ABC-type glycerol-3-phosphate transport system substrate-binding protein